MVSILKPANHEGNNVFLDARNNAHAYTELDATIPPPAPIGEENFPPPPPLFPSSPQPPEMSDILTNLVNLLQQKNDRLKHV